MLTLPIKPYAICHETYVNTRRFVAGSIKLADHERASRISRFDLKQSRMDGEGVNGGRGIEKRDHAIVIRSSVTTICASILTIFVHSSYLHSHFFRVDSI